MLISRRWDEDKDRVWYDKFKENVTMTYAHAVNLSYDVTPVWLYAICNADFRNTHPEFLEKYDLLKFYVQSDGTLFEFLEEEDE